MPEREESSLVKMLETILEEAEKREDRMEQDATKQEEEAHKMYSRALEMRKASATSPGTKESSRHMQLLAIIEAESSLRENLSHMVAVLDTRTLRLCYVLALQTRALQASLNQMEKDLTKSGVLKKVKKIQNVERELTKILKSVKEDTKKAEESRRKYLPYVG